MRLLKEADDLEDMGEKNLLGCGRTFELAVGKRGRVVVEKGDSSRENKKQAVSLWNTVAGIGEDESSIGEGETMRLSSSIGELQDSSESRRGSGDGAKEAVLNEEEVVDE